MNSIEIRPVRAETLRRILDGAHREVQRHTTRANRLEAEARKLPPGSARREHLIDAMHDALDEAEAYRETIRRLR